MAVLIAVIVLAGAFRSLSGGVWAVICLVSIPLGGIIYMMVRKIWKDRDLPGEAWDAATPRAAEPAPPETPPSTDRLPTQRLLLPATAMRIGRTPDNDLPLADLGVSRHHAELRKSPTGGYEIVDLGSHNGTFVNGKRVSQVMLTEHDIVSIGHSTFRLAGSELWQFVDDSGELTK